MEYQPIDRLQLKQIQAAYEAGFARCMETICELKPYLSLKEAHKMYGRKTVERWVKEGLIEILKDGTGTSKCRISRERIELVASQSNRASWYTHHE